MRVALINPPLRGHTIRGTGIYAKNLVTQLEKFPDVEVLQCELKHLPKHADVYHFPYFDPFFLTLPWLHPTKTVVTIHDLIPIKFPTRFPRGIRGELKWQIQKRLVRGIDAIITDSEASKNDIIEYIGTPETRVFKIYLAPDPVFLKKIDREHTQEVQEKYHLPNTFFIYVGEMNWNKNVPIIIRASTKAQVPLVILSKSFVERQDHDFNRWKESLLEAQALARGNSLVHGLGYVPMIDQVALYTMARGLVFPSLYEGFGLPVVEAFAAGCPVITTDRGSLKEVAGDAALFVEGTDMESIATGIKNLMRDPVLRQKLIAKGRRQVKRFSWQKTAQQTLNVYNTVIGVRHL